MISISRFLQYLLLHLFVHLYDHFALSQQQNQFVYNGFNAANLRLNGAAWIHPNGLLELTNFSKRQIGRAFFAFPMNFSSSLSNNSLSFSTSFVFAMVPEMPNYGGHGLAFTIAPSMELPGAVSAQFLGLLNSTNNWLPSNHVFAVELDSIGSADMIDMNDNHVGIDVNSLVSNVSASAGYFSDEDQELKSLKLVSGDPMQVWIDYDDEEKVINVTMAPETIPKPTRPLLSTPLDLSLVLSDSAYVGFSSSTGSMASYHYILGWSFNRSGPAQSLESSKLPSLPSPQRNSSKKTELRIIIPLVSLVVVLIPVSVALYVLRRRKYEELREDWEQEYGPQRFSYKDLHKATKGFRDNELLGSGGFGRVYKGVLPSSNVQVAVKRVAHDSEQGMKQFVAEIVSMGRLRHRNLVQLLGYCRRKGELLLVYDHMPNGSLDYFLFRRNTPNLNWVQRFQILRGVASALLYLHEEWEQVVLHRDVKASNILLDAEFNGRLGDFGLAKFYDRDANPQTTCVVGTVGYLAPELTRTGRSTSSTDVFAFGVFMLEVACGRKPFEPEKPSEEVFLVDWVLDHWRKGDILATSDPRLEGEYVPEEMELVSKLGLLCAHPIPASRPGMRQVVQYLDGTACLPEMSFDTNISSVGPVVVSCESSEDCVLSVYTSHDVSADTFSSSGSILSYGR